MKKKLPFLILILVFAVVLGGAYVLYGQLSQGEAPEQLAVVTQPATQAATQPAQTAAAHATTAATQATTEPAAEDIPAPDFTVYDKAGNPVKLSDFFGKPIVLNFWASWCGPCKMEMPDFQEKQKELDGQVQFLMINMTDGSRETVETASAFIENQGYTFPVFFDTTQEAAYAYGASSLPTSYFIDAGGNVIAYAVGAIDGATLQRGIDMIS